MNKFVIIFWSISEWDKIGRRPMIRALARNLEGIANILYVDTPFSRVATFLFNRDRYFRNRKGRLLKRISKNLYIFRPKGLINNYAIDRLGLQEKYCDRLGKKVKEIIRVLGWDNCKRVSWINYPSQTTQLRVVDESLVVYECYDEYRSYSQDETKNALVSGLEDELLKRVDIVFTTSGPLYESRRELHPKVFLTSNGVDFNLFHSAKNATAGRKILDLPRPIIGYVGHITPQFVDFELLEFIAEYHDDKSLVLIGSIHHKAKTIMQKLKNRYSHVLTLGEKPHAQIPAYLREMDIAIMPFITDHYVDSSNPLTMWEYMASGIAVVSPRLRSLKALGVGDTIFFADSKEGFANRIEQILENRKNGYLEQRLEMGVALARKYSWASVTKEIANILISELSQIQDFKDKTNTGNT